jgi:hypothetical protein
MRSLWHPLGVLLLASVLGPEPGAAAGATHPLDPAGSAGVMPTRNIFEDAVPLLNRESPQPSFVGDEEAASTPAEATPAPEGTPTHHGAMGHGTPQAE